MNQSTTDAPPAETLDSCRTTDIKGDSTKLILTYLLAIQDLASKAKMEVTPENLAYGKVVSTQSVFAGISSICEAAKAVVSGTEICRDVSASASELASSEAQGSSQEANEHMQPPCTNTAQPRSPQIGSMDVAEQDVSCQAAREQPSSAPEDASREPASKDHLETGSEDTGKGLATIGSTKSFPIDLTIEEAPSCRKDSGSSYKRKQPDSPSCPPEAKRFKEGLRIWATDIRDEEGIEYVWNSTGKGWMQIDDRTKYYSGQLDEKLESLSVMVRDVSDYHRFWLKHDAERNIWTGRGRDDRVFMVGPKTLSRLVLQKATRPNAGGGFFNDRS